MSDVSFFQKYSQAENVATNNTLLLFRHFYRNAPEKMQQIFSELLDQELDVGLKFNQQVRHKKSIPDAVISQSPIDIYIETKSDYKLDDRQIILHAEGRGREFESRRVRQFFKLPKFYSRASGGFINTSSALGIAPGCNHH